MFAQREAILRLLRDDDAPTVALVKDQLILRGVAARDGLNDLLSVGDPVITRHVEGMLGQIDADEARQELAELCRDFPDHGGLDALEYATFLLARCLEPGIDTQSACRQLDAWGVMLAKRIADELPEEEKVRRMGDFFGRELDLHGDTEHYYKVGNSLLPKVIATRRGIPLSLSLIYLFTGARAGLPIEGVSFPGHFLVRLGSTLLDPFERGRFLSNCDAAAILARQKLPVVSAYFQTACERMIFYRMLANLLYLYRCEDPKVADLLEGWMHDLKAGPGA